MIRPSEAAKSLLTGWMAASLLIAAGCASSPQQRLARECPECDRHTITIASELSPLTALMRVRKPQDKKRLHIYLEGDGRPWTPWNTPADDPNSHSLTALKLMQSDNANSVYLNRPCYAEQPMADPCHHGLWTDGRYSEQVVTAMNKALDAIQMRAHAEQLVLVGYSGGGTLAMLLAQRRTDVVAVVTLAANLDHAAWTDHFGHLPLANSLNAARVILPAHVLRWHFAAEQDRQVPAPLIASVAASDPYARVETLKGFTHGCCWMQIWPRVLQELDDQLQNSP